MKFPRTMPLAAAALAALLALGGCASVNEYRAPRVEMPDTAPVPPAPPPAPAAANGAIFQGASYRPLFEDHRARLPGDTLTVQIVEAVSASQKSTSSVDKSGKVDASVSQLPLLNSSSSLLGRLGAGASSSNNFAGAGATASSNDFSGTITAMVTGVLPNGHLLVAGEKQIGVNANVDVLRFSGQVDPRAIQPGNMVPSARIANVRVEHRGRGQQADAQLMGWLGRFFLNVLPF
ncbi:flagellar basal body L-ring protein FlgH [Azohydromonas australica]|uniref:flagellar basal body L-ring protein FlgH n=1 Tax=Azohydromonas australica TaxID=364039 RepID=UPI0004183A4A|nr:flagellar basal body L-ring protein FlgH [Azohydromonas australica]